MRKWLKRAGLGIVVLGVLVLLSGVVYEQWSRWTLGRTLSPPGRMVDVGGRGMHIRCLGQGAPTVVLEAGFGVDASGSWDPVIEDIASVTRVCAYDRPGLLWSDPGEKPRDAHRSVEDLHALLSAADESPPFLMVGHSLGGPLVRVFADQYPEEVGGMVLVDSSHPEQEERMPPEIQDLSDSMMPSPVRMRFLAATGVMRFFTRSGGSGPDAQEPDPMMARLPQSVPGLLAEMKVLTEIMGQAGSTGDLGDLPLVVLSAGSMDVPIPGGITEELERQMTEMWEGLQGELAALSTNSDHRIIDDATHYIHHDRPEVVVTAITDVVMAVRGGSQLAADSSTSGGL